MLKHCSCALMLFHALMGKSKGYSSIGGSRIKHTGAVPTPEKDAPTYYIAKNCMKIKEPRDGVVCPWWLPRICHCIVLFLLWLIIIIIISLTDNSIIFFWTLFPVADPRGALPARVSTPTDQNFLNFMQFFNKSGKFVYWQPPGGLVPSPTRNPGSAPDFQHIHQITLCKNSIYILAIVIPSLSLSCR